MEAILQNHGDIIFFLWDYDRQAGYSYSHVGIVEKVEGNTVYTIEGNTNIDECASHSYNINARQIVGYGTPNYR